MHDQRHRHSSSSKTIKVSSPTLRKLCLPCISARNHPRQQLSSKRQSAKPNQRRLAPTENIIDESPLPRFEVPSRTYDPVASISVVHSNDDSKGNDANHFHDRHQHLVTSLQEERHEERSNEISVAKAETNAASTDRRESSPSHEITRSNEEDAVGFPQDRKISALNWRVERRRAVLQRVLHGYQSLFLPFLFCLGRWSNAAVNIGTCLYYQEFIEPYYS